ncbi:MAG TPA: metallophosphoesterase [Candidatus Aquicultor sp.]|jgi:hypothetical protein
MPDIRYVCLSDMHLGEESSLLTNLQPGSLEPDLSQASTVLERLTGCLRHLIEGNRGPKKPTLILCGDTLEFALALDNQAAMAFERFIELTMHTGEPLFESIIYIPGNHDHHLWELARETQYLNFIQRKAPGEYLPVPWHSTKLFIENEPYVPVRFLTGLVQRHEHFKDYVVAAAYPNLGLITEDKRKCIVFHHGHFIESMYMLMSTLKTILFPEHVIPDNVRDLEAENYAWIDFFWSTMGRSGEAGTDIEVIYHRMQDPDAFKRLLKTLASSVAKKIGFPGVFDLVETELLHQLLCILADVAFALERNKDIGYLSADAENGLKRYVGGPVKNQLLSECGGTLPSDITFVFGHTHKAYHEDMPIPGFANNIHLCNTGGWVFEQPVLRPVIGGAVALLDENLDTVLLRMYNEEITNGVCSLELFDVNAGSAQPSLLHQHLAGLINSDDSLWGGFSETVANDLKMRSQLLAAQQSQDLLTDTVS